MAEQGAAVPAFASLIKEMNEMATSTSDDNVDISLSPATRDPDDGLISLVREGTRTVDPGEYSPVKVYIGPYDYDRRSDDPYLLMETKKKELLHGFLPRDKREREDKLNSYLTMAKEGVEVRARQYYNNTFNELSQHDFACMLLLDGCYLLSCFVPITGMDGGRSTSSVPDEDMTVVRDVVFLLQNQIPFFVLEKIHKFITVGAEHEESFVLRSVTSHVEQLDGATGGAEYDESFVLRGAAGHIEKLVRRHEYSVATLNWDLDSAPRRPCHLLHLLYMYFRPAALDLAGGPRTCPPISVARHLRKALFCTPGGSLRERVGEVQLTVDDPVAINGNGAGTTSGSGAGAGAGAGPAVPPVRFRAAAYYHVAGVRLVKRKLGGVRARSILDVELAGGTLHVPFLMVDRNTLRILRNMVALEQNSPQLGSHVTAYTLFMSQMASTEKDVALLVAKGIVVHFFPSDADVAAELAGLCKGIRINVNNPDFSYLRREQEALEELCRDGWRRSMAWLRHTKCNNPLMFLALVAAVIAFVSTVLQALFAVLAYCKGKNC